MVNLLPDEMKKEEEGQDFNKEKKEREKKIGKKDFLMTKPVSEAPSKKKSPAFLQKLRDFIFKKKKKEEKKAEGPESILSTKQSFKEQSKAEEKDKKGEVIQTTPEEKKDEKKEEEGSKKEEFAQVAFKEEKQEEKQEVPQFTFQKKEEGKSKERKKRKGKGEKERKEKGKGASQGLGVSLMPEETMIISRVVRSRLIFLILSIVIISVLFILTRLYGGLYFDKRAAEVENIKREISLLEVQSRDFLEQRNAVIKLNNKAEEVQRALDQHIYWRNFFDFLEKYTLPDVYFGDFTAQAQEPVRLNAQAKDLISLARQIVAFREADDFVEKIEVSGVQKNGEGDGVQALLEITLFEDIWQK
ncbi:hypothetical protein K9K85_02190 [Patescibacteria group bacterium]|nr:hypothetical protein [Patescibacteria group bacterium]